MVSRTVEKAIYVKYKGICAICREKTAFDMGEVDHKNPKAKGGTDKPNNSQWLCHRCNKLKGQTRTNKEVKELLGDVGERTRTPTGRPPKYVVEAFGIMKK